MASLIAILGAGGHARSVANVIISLPQYQLFRFFDTPVAVDERIFGVPVVELPRDPRGIAEMEIRFLAIGFGNNYRRSEIISSSELPELETPTLIHPTAYIGHDVNVGAGTVVMPGAIINVSAQIGRFCVINSGAIVEHGTIVGDYSHLSPGATVASDVVIGSHVFVGIGASIIGGITIGDRTVVGGAAIVVEDLEAGILAVGVPARKVRALERGWSPV